MTLSQRPNQGTKRSLQSAVGSMIFFMNDAGTFGFFELFHGNIIDFVAIKCIIRALFAEREMSQRLCPCGVPPEAHRTTELVVNTFPGRVDVSMFFEAMQLEPLTSMTRVVALTTL